MKRIIGKALVFSLCVLATGQLGAMDAEKAGVTLKLERYIHVVTDNGQSQDHYRSHEIQLNTIWPQEVLGQCPGAVFHKKNKIYYVDANNPDIRVLMQLEAMRRSLVDNQVDEELDECLKLAAALNHARSANEPTLPHTRALRKATMHFHSRWLFADTLLASTQALCTIAAAGDPHKIFEGATATAGKGKAKK